MLEFFGGKPSVVADARVERTDVVSGMRGTGLNAPSVERSINENNENVSSETPASESLSESTVTGTLDITFKRRKDVRRDDVANTNIVSEPGPEYVGDQQCLDGGVSAVQQSGSDAEHEEIETMTISSSGKASSEWGEANENVLESRSNGSSQRSSRASRHHFDNGEPGPEHYGDDSAATIDDGGAYVRGQVHENGESVLEQPGAHNGHAASAANGQAGGMPVAAQAPILIRGAQVVNDDSIFNADVLIEDKVIKQVSTSLDAPNGATVIEGNGKLLLPAGIDVHTDFSFANSAEDFATGSKAALAGGTATVIDVVNPRGGESVLAACDRVRKAAEAKSLCNFGFSVVISTWNDIVKKEMGLVVKDKGINSFIIDLHSDDQLYQAFEFCKTIGAHARVVPENKNIISFLERKMLSLGITGPEGFLQSRPESLEGEFVDRLAVLSQLTNCPLAVMSVSSSEARDAVLRNRINSLIFPEVSVAALATDGTHYFNKCARHAAAHMTACPLRVDLRTSSLLVECLASSPLCVCVSDHRGLRDRGVGDFTQMTVGVSAVEERMSIVWEKAVYPGGIDPMRFVAVTSSNAAKMFNLYPKKGRIAVGADADVVLWDASAKRKFSVKTQQSLSDFSIFESFVAHAAPLLTVCDGRIAYRDGKFDEEAGRFIQLTSHSPYLFCAVQQRERMQTPEKVERDETAGGSHRASPPSRVADYRHPAVHGRGQFDTSFGTQVDDMRTARASTKVLNPPGGRSTGFW